MNRHVLRSAMGGAVLLGGLLLAPVMPGAHAQTSTCRSDPVVYLSNGDVLTLGATIYDSASDIGYVGYNISMPPGVSITNVVNTTGVIGKKEKFTYDNKASTGEYVTTTKVSTTLSPIQVTATGQENGGAVDSLNGLAGSKFVFTWTVGGIS